MHIIISTYFYNLYNITFKNIYTLQYYIQIYIYLQLEKNMSLGIYARMHYVICILCAIRIQTRVSQQFVQSGNCGKTSLVTADCDSVNSSLRAKKQFCRIFAFNNPIWEDSGIQRSNLVPVHSDTSILVPDMMIPRCSTSGGNKLCCDQAHHRSTTNIIYVQIGEHKHAVYPKHGGI